MKVEQSSGQKRVGRQKWGEALSSCQQVFWVLSSCLYELSAGEAGQSGQNGRAPGIGQKCFLTKEEGPDDGR